MLNVYYIFDYQKLSFYGILFVHLINPRIIYECRNRININSFSFIYSMIFISDVFASNPLTYTYLRYLYILFCSRPLYFSISFRSVLCASLLNHLPLYILRVLHLSSPNCMFMSLMNYVVCFKSCALYISVLYSSQYIVHN